MRRIPGATAGSRIIRRLSEKLEPIARETGLRAVQVKEKFGDLRVYVRGADGERVLPDAIAETVHAAIGAAIKEASRICQQCGAACPRRKARSWVTLCDPCRERAEAQRAERRRRWREGPVAIPGAEVRVWLDDVRDRARRLDACEDGTGSHRPARSAAESSRSAWTTTSVTRRRAAPATRSRAGSRSASRREGFEPPAMRIHSANVVGRERMQRAIESIERLRRRGA